MKKNKLNILCAWLLLICFAAGQYMVCIHQHLQTKGITKTEQSACNHQVVKEKCYMCDAMHHNPAVVYNNTLFLKPLLASSVNFKSRSYDFVSLALILSAGRAPPVIS